MSTSALVWLRPVAGELLVGHPPQQHGVRRGHLRTDRRAHLVVEVGEVPLVRRLEDAVQRDEQPRHDLSHDALLKRGPGTSVCSLFCVFYARDTE